MPSLRYCYERESTGNIAVCVCKAPSFLFHFTASRLAGVRFFLLGGKRTHKKKKIAEKEKCGRCLQAWNFFPFFSLSFARSDTGAAIRYTGSFQRSREKKPTQRRDEYSNDIFIYYSTMAFDQWRKKNMPRERGGPKNFHSIRSRGENI